MPTKKKSLSKGISGKTATLAKLEAEIKQLSKRAKERDSKFAQLAAELAALKGSVMPKPGPDGKLSIDQVMPLLNEKNKTGVDFNVDASPGLGFDRIKHIPGSTYRDSSTVIVIPERTPFFHQKAFQSWYNLIAPMNQKRCHLIVTNDEVGKAYDNAIKEILAHPELSKWKYILSIESDNIPPADGHIRLLESIEWGSYDAIGGLYFTRGDINMCMAYGDPAEYKRTGVLDFKPLDIKTALAAGNVCEVNGLACGFTLWRMDIFRKLQPPWFQTVNDIVEGKGAQCFTQDLWHCSNMKRAGMRLAVDLRVKVGHMDLNTSIVY